jgi:hypothetical protein
MAINSPQLAYNLGQSGEDRRASARFQATNQARQSEYFVERSLLPDLATHAVHIWALTPADADVAWREEVGVHRASAPTSRAVAGLLLMLC